MIVGVGTDILSLERFRRTLDDGFRRSVYTSAELEQAVLRPDATAALAMRFAGKEAVFKALRLDGNTRWQEIEILSQPDGAPAVRLHGPAAAHASGLRAGTVWLSLSCDTEYACAFAVAEGKD